MKFLFERKPQSLSTERETSKKVFLISGLMKQVLNSQNKSTIMTDFMNTYLQTNRASVDYYPVSHQDQKLVVIKTASVNDMKCQRSLIVCQCQICITHHRPGETFCTCGRMLQGITEEDKKQAEQRIKNRFTMYVPGNHNSELKSTP